MIPSRGLGLGLWLTLFLERLQRERTHSVSRYIPVQSHDSVKTSASIWSHETGFPRTRLSLTLILASGRMSRLQLVWYLLTVRPHTVSMLSLLPLKLTSNCLQALIHCKTSIKLFSRSENFSKRSIRKRSVTIAQAVDNDTCGYLITFVYFYNSYHSSSELLPSERWSPIQRMRLLGSILVLLPDLDGLVRLSRDQSHSSQIKGRRHNAGFRI
jgi:hypothetical protein